MAKDKGILTKILEEKAARAGITEGEHNGDFDAFRHLYSAAIGTRYVGANITKIAGKTLEWGTHVFSKDGNPTDEWQMDEHNNVLGTQLGEQAEAEGWDDEKLIQEVGKVIRNGRAKVLKRGEDPNAPTGYPGYGAAAEDTKLKFPQDIIRERKRQRFAEQMRRPTLPAYRTPPITDNGMSPPASILDSLRAFIKKK